MLCHRDRQMTKPEARRPLRPPGYDGMGPAAALPLLDRWGASTSSWRLASSPMALVTRPYRLPPRAARGLSPARRSTKLRSDSGPIRIDPATR